MQSRLAKRAIISHNLMQTKMALEWRRRLQRVRNLEEENAAAKQILRFYAAVLQVQSEIAEDCAASGQILRPGAGFKSQIDLELPLRKLASLLSVTRREGTKVLVEGTLRFSDIGLAKQKLKAFLATEQLPHLEDPDMFFVLAMLQPIAEHLAGGALLPDHTTGRCPVCDSLPLLAILRPEGDGAKRSLQCSLCLYEWPYRRVLCPWCGETNKDKLPRYTAEECDNVRIEACDTCKHYLKSFDLTVNGHAVPIVDEVALAALDVWAVEQGFRKIANNLLGF